MGSLSCRRGRGNDLNVNREKRPDEIFESGRDNRDSRRTLIQGKQAWKGQNGLFQGPWRDARWAGSDSRPSREKHAGKSEKNDVERGNGT